MPAMAWGFLRPQPKKFFDLAYVIVVVGWWWCGGASAILVGHWTCLFICARVYGQSGIGLADGSKNVLFITKISEVVT
jgi:hypothetical protein